MWESYIQRKRLAQLDDDQRSLVTALLSNGQMEQDALQSELESINERFDELRRQVLSGDSGESDEPEEEQFVQDQWW